MLSTFDILLIIEKSKRIIFERGNRLTIYLDVIWLLNFFIDLILLMITQLMVRRHTTYKRLFLGAFIASTLVPLTIFYPNSFFTTVYGKLTYSLLIVFASFPFRSISSYIQTLLSFYFISFVIGGGLFAVHYLISSPISLTNQGLVTFNQGYGDPVSWLFVICCFPIISYFTKRRLDKYEIEQIKFDHLYRVKITMNGVEKEANGFLDSGNQLIDPLTNYPVIICDEPFMKQWFEEEEWDLLKEANETLMLNTIPDSILGKIHLIPYRGVDGKNQMFISLKPDDVTVLIDEKKKVSIKKVFIGIQFSTLAKDRNYNCLLQPKLFQGEKIIA